MKYISHPKIVPDKVEERMYQVNIAKACLSENTLAILPTGMGKTIVAVHVSANILQKGKKVLLLAPTKPLVDQHSQVFSELLKDTSVGVINGNMAPAARTKIIQNSELIVSTPQCIANDLEKERYDLKDFGLVIYDEAHRGTGNYAYVRVATHYDPVKLSMGMTASPGSDPKKIEEVCDNLMLVKIEMRTEEDPDVTPYVHDTYINRIEVNMPPELLDVIKPLKDLLDHYFIELTNLRIADPNWPISTKHMLVIAESLQRRLARGEKTAVVFRGLTVQAICVKLLHAVSLAETQGMSALRTYMIKLNEEGESSTSSKGGRELISQKKYLEAWEIVRSTKVEHPKISRVMSLVSQILNSSANAKVIVFTQYRDTCDLLVEKLSNIPDAKVGKLIGQSNGGLKQKEQIGILDDFRNGDYNVIVSTSVGEEGLDITSTNAVIFYEPVPSEIRTIQRRGRTGRKNDGDVYVLIAKGTVDEVFENSSKKKEEQMRSRLEKLNKDLSKKKPTRKNGQVKFS